MSDSSQPTQYRTVGIVLAIGSGVLIGTSFVLKKKGLLRSQAGHEAGEGVAYLKSVRDFRKVGPSNTDCSLQPMWWSGMTSMCSSQRNVDATSIICSDDHGRAV